MMKVSEILTMLILLREKSEQLIFLIDEKGKFIKNKEEYFSSSSF
jgi:hypothetical protein